MTRRPSQADYLLGAPQEPGPAKRKPHAKVAVRQAEPTPTPTSSRERITVYIRADLYAEVKGATVALGLEGKRPSSVSALLDDALEHEIDRLRREHNGGRPFRPFPGGLPGGRPRR